MWNNIKSLARAIGADLAPGVSVAVQGLSDLASEAGDAYEKLKLIAEGDFNFEGLSLGPVRRTMRGTGVRFRYQRNCPRSITPWSVAAVALSRRSPSTLRLSNGASSSRPPTR